MRRRQFIVFVGAAALWPTLATAQQPAIPVIGFMSGRSPGDSRHLLAAFHQGLGEAGFVEGKTSLSNTGGRPASTTGCRHWPLIS
jgi:putative ABC transport system substrate-binding protein